MTDHTVARGAATLLDGLERTAATSGDRGFRFVGGDGSTERAISFVELRDDALALGQRLSGMIAIGARAVLVYPPGIDFIIALLGIQAACAIPVPAYPPDFARLERALDRLRGILLASKADLVLTTEALVHGLGTLLDRNGMGHVRVAATDTGEASAPSNRRNPVASDLAFLQFTSGSTAEPRGVMISHATALAHSHLLAARLGARSGDDIVGWLPLYHDMGLVGTVLMPMLLGLQTTLMSPVTFLKRPAIWLEMMTRHRGAISPAPNFAFDLCVRKIPEPERRGFELSSWRVACNGSEPVQAATLERFSQAFGPHGFRAETHYPCYGLAEITLFATGGLPGKRPRQLRVDPRSLEVDGEPVRVTEQDGRQMVSSGIPLPDHELVIVDPETLEPRNEGKVGEILICGVSVAQGYWNDPVATADVFGAVLPDGSGPFVRTGDLGFLHDGELFVCGRRKDLIVIAGRNLYPQDVERTVEECPEVRPGCSAAFSIENAEGEALVVVVELRGTATAGEPVLAALRRAIVSNHDVDPVAIVVVPSGTIPKAPNGKIQRHATRRAFLDDQLQAAAVWDRRSPTQVRPGQNRADLLEGLIERLARELGVAPAAIDPELPFADHGLGSVGAAALAGDLEDWLDIDVEPTVFWEFPTPAALAEALGHELAV